MRLPSPDAHGWRAGGSVPGWQFVCCATLLLCLWLPFLPLPPKSSPYTNEGSLHSRCDNGIDRPVCISSSQAALPGDKVSYSDLCSNRISQDICHEQYRFGLCPTSWLSVARTFFVFYANETIGWLALGSGWSAKRPLGRGRGWKLSSSQWLVTCSYGTSERSSDIGVPEVLG